MSSFLMSCKLYQDITDLIENSGICRQVIIIHGTALGIVLIQSFHFKRRKFALKISYSTST